MMKIGYLSQPWDDGPPDLEGSISRWAWEVSRRLAGSCEVLVFGPAVGRHPKIEQWGEVKFVRVPMVADHWLISVAQKLSQCHDPRRRGIASNIYYKFYALRAAWAFRNYGCDIVHIHNFSQFAPVVKRISPRARIVLHMHCDWLVQLDYDLINRRLAEVDAIVGTSEYVTRQVRRRFPQHAHRCNTVFNGVDTQAFHPADGDSQPQRENLVYVGRLSPEKGVHVLLDSFKEVVRRRPGVALELIGGSGSVPPDFIVNISEDPIVRNLGRFYLNESYTNYLQWQVRTQLSNRVVFTAHLPHDQVTKHLQAATLLVAPSLVETFGMPVAEAMASGLPVVASRAGGLPEVVEDGNTGLLVAPDNPKQLADAVVRMLSDRAAAQAMGRAGRQRAENLFTWDKAVASLRSIYGN
jgi:glycosyltransferase involved in cell wall biosynthesis